MLARILPIAFALASTLAHADIYTWVDKTGNINISNLQPPDGVRVTNVMHESPRADPPSPDVQMLSERVRQLEQELAARQPAPPPYPVAPYPVVQAPPPMQYPSVQYQIIEQPPMQYAGYGGPQANYGWNAGCDPQWWDCPNLWGYPSTVVVVAAPGFRRPFVPHGGGHRFPPPKTGRVPGGMHRR